MPLSTSITSLPLRVPDGYTDPPPHHIGQPPNSFINPWSSYRHTAPIEAFKTRFLSNSSKNFIPIPLDRKNLVRVHQPNFTATASEGNSDVSMRATWIGHASFLVESAGLKILVDPVWSTRVGPYGLIGPIRFTDPPCSIEEIPHVDAVLISHDHYDHLDAPTLKALYRKEKGNLRFFCALGVKRILLGLGVGIPEEQVTEMDWWNAIRLHRTNGEDKNTPGTMDIVCTPAQHRSGRTPWRFQKSLWCSWVLKSSSSPSPCPSTHPNVPGDISVSTKSLFFAGDTGYCNVTTDAEYSHHHAPHPPCPAFSQIGALHGPFDLSLLPIGCFKPRSFMSAVHASPDDALAIHRDVRSKKSLGMHYGTFRGDISAHYEPVTEPVERFKEGAVGEGLSWGEGVDGEWEVGVCGIGETVMV